MQHLDGNSNTYLERTNDLSPPVVASKVRFVPRSRHPRTVCMRVELYGCAFDPEAEPVAYRAPKGDEFSPHVYLEDVYDGTDGKGLGVLTDGLAGGEVSLSDRGIDKGEAD